MQIPLTLQDSPPSYIPSATVDQRLVYPERSGFGRTPREHSLTANAVPEHFLLFSNENASAVLRNRDAETRACQPSTDDHKIVVHLVSSPREHSRPKLATSLIQPAALAL